MAPVDNDRQDESVTVRTCVWGHEADLLRSVLAGSGIASFIPDERMGSLRPHLLLGTGGVRLQVHASDLERATDLLNAADENGPTAAGDDDAA
jgi:hypothetical protein